MYKLLQLIIRERTQQLLKNIVQYLIWLPIKIDLMHLDSIIMCRQECTHYDQVCMCVSVCPHVHMFVCVMHVPVCGIRGVGSRSIYNFVNGSIVATSTLSCWINWIYSNITLYAAADSLLQCLLHALLYLLSSLQACIII